MDASVQHGLRYQVHELTLHQTLDRPGSVCRVVTLFRHIVLESLGEGYGDSVSGELLFQVIHLQMQDFPDILLRERFEHYDLVYTVQEFRPYRALEHIDDFLTALAQKFLAFPVRGIVGEPVHISLDDFGSGIGRHYQYCILEVHGTSLVVRQTAVVEDLQKYIEDIRMRLFDFVKQDYRVRFPPDGFRKLSAFIIADISRRRSDQTAHRMTLLILAHIYSGNHVLVIEQKFRKRFCQLCLADAGSTQEKERSDRTFLVLQTCPASAHGI